MHHKINNATVEDVPKEMCPDREVRTYAEVDGAIDRESNSQLFRVDEAERGERNALVWRIATKLIPQSAAQPLRLK